ncbi:MAG: hypothetical protein U0531_07890 [Dehalococcoidia bacterium]
MGIRVEDEWDSLTIYPGAPQPAVIGCSRPSDGDELRRDRAARAITISDPGCVAKTFPDFFAVLDRARGDR